MTPDRDQDRAGDHQDRDAYVRDAYVAVSAIRAGISEWLAMYERTGPEAVGRATAPDLIWALGFVSGLEAPLIRALTPDLRQRFAALRDRLTVEVELRVAAEREADER